jgi:pimeloyl-ACP methyl ester carboxylesterase
MMSEKQEKGPQIPPARSGFIAARVLAFVLACLQGVCVAAPSGPVITGYRGFRLPAKLDLPDQTGAPAVARAVVLLHGSGPQNMDEDLSALCAPGTRNRWFVDVSGALVKRGFAVVRYDKRSWMARERLAAEPKWAASKDFTAYASDPLRYFVEDARCAVKWARGRMPRARVFVLGHSEGAIVALEVAREEKSVAGVGLVGFAAVPLDVLLYEQFVYRSLNEFDKADPNRDGKLDPAELGAEGVFHATVKAQMGLLDGNGDGALERSEYMAGNLSNILLDGPSVAEYRSREAGYPRAAATIAELKVPVAFFQGEWDNQTPAWNARAVEMLNKALWKKENLRFRFFPGLGHALDPRDGYYDLVYRPIDRKALEDMAQDLDGLWR